MSFTAGNIQAMEDAFKAGMGVLLQPQQVDLYQGATVNINLYVGTRRANETEVTGGAVADTQLVAIVDADDWDAKAGRPPQIGDVIWWMGERNAVSRASGSAPAGNRVFYKVFLEG